MAMDGQGNKGSSLLEKPVNMPGLSRIRYRIGTYSDFRKAMMDRLDRDEVLGAWTHRGADDPGIALLEGAAVLGDILTFYQELYANEAYLRTAQWRESVGGLVGVTGYRLAPGLGGTVTFAVEVKGDRPVKIPRGFPIKAQLEGSERPAEFETCEEADAYQSLNRFFLYRRLYTPRIQESTNEFYIKRYGNAPETMLNAGDRLMISDQPMGSPSDLKLPDNAQIVTVDSVRSIHGTQVYKIKDSLQIAGAESGSMIAVNAYLLGRSFRHFGHNAPSKYYRLVNHQMEEVILMFWRATNGDCRSNEVTWSGETVPRVWAVEPTIDKDDIPLDREVNDLAGGRLIVRGEMLNDAKVYSRDFVHVRTIKDTKNISMTWGALTGATTGVTLDYELTTRADSKLFDIYDIRKVECMEVVGPRLELRPAFVESEEVSGSELYFFGTNAEARLLSGRRLLFDGAAAGPFTARVTDVQMLGEDVASQVLGHRITIDRTVEYAQFPNAGPRITVYGNLVDATEGRRERETVLGNGDSGLAFQRFRLPKAPLTCLASASATPPYMPELTVYVNDHQWEQVPSFFGRSPGDEVYVVREDVDGNSWIEFGDGKTGRRLPTGIGNITAVYRTGTGAFGRLKEGATVQPGSRLDRLDKIRLPGVVSGGHGPESGDSAKEAAPGRLQSLGRLVSLRDYESEALAYPGVTMAQAAWGEKGRAAIDLLVLMDAGRSGEFDSARKALAGYDRNRGLRRFPVDVRPASRGYLYLEIDYGLDPAYREEPVSRAIAAALGAAEGPDEGARGLFAIRRRDFGQEEYATTIEAIVQNVEGVVWARIAKLLKFRQTAEPFTLDTAESYEITVDCAPDQVLCLLKKHLRLNRAGTEGT